MRMSLFILAILVMVAGTAAADVPAKSASPGSAQFTMSAGKAMAEGFEGDWLPTDWSHVQTNPDSLFTWHQADSLSYLPYEGYYLARVGYATDLTQQDEKLGFDYTVETDDVLTFALSASTYWTTNYNVFVEIDGVPVWDFATDGNGLDFEYELYYVDLAAYIGSSIHVDFYYSGLDGADAYLDAVAVGDVDYPATLTGNVTDGSVPLEGVRVHGYDGSLALVFDALTDELGDYDAGVQLPIGDYTVMCDLFGYDHYETPVTLVEHANVLDPSLVLGPTGDVAGFVIDASDSSPIEALVSAYRNDTGELITQTTAGVDGSYTLAALPHYTYDISASAYGYVTESGTVDVDGSEVLDFALTSTDGMVLVINDNPSTKSMIDKFDGGSLIAKGYRSAGNKGAADFVTDLATLGYGAVIETMDTTDPSGWSAYEFLVVDSSDNFSSLSNETFRSALAGYASGGGKLLISGGEMGYTWNSNAEVAGMLHISDWTHDESGSVYVADPTHSVMNTPNAFTDTLVVDYIGYADHDAVTIDTAGPGYAVMAGLWTDYPTDASVVCWSIDSDPAAGNTIYLPFNYGNADTNRVDLLENAAAWLTAESTIQPTASISGTTTLEGTTDYTGVLVELSNGDSVTTGADGTYTFTGLYGATYTVTASIAGYVTDSVEVTIVDEEVLAGVDLNLLIYVEPATLTGNVTDGVGAAEDIRVRGYDGTMTLLFDVLTDVNGDYDAGTSITPADITVMFDAYGYAHHEEVITLVSGANVLDHVLAPGTTADLTGTVTAAMGGTPLEATVTVTRADNDEQVAQVTCGIDGTYSVDLPLFTFNVTASQYGYISQTAEVVLAGTAVQDFALDSASGVVLVIDDSPAKGNAPDKLDENGSLIAKGYASSGRGTIDLVADLATLGYGTVVETMASSDPLSWSGYEFLVVACGDNATTLADSTFRAALVPYANAGGKVLFEGGELGFDWQNDADMAGILHIADWGHDSSGSVYVADPTHSVMSTPNAITDTLSVDYVSYGDHDSVILEEPGIGNAVMAGLWTDYPDQASVVCWSIDGDADSGNTVYFAFDYSNADTARIDLLENATAWLTTESPIQPLASISGTVTLEGVTDFTGVLVELSNGASVTTGMDGTYTFAGLYGGNYTVTASITDYVTDSIPVVLADEETLTGADLQLLLYVEPATLTGNVTDGVTAIEGVRVHGYDDTMTLVFDVLTDVSGDYDAGISITPAAITVMFDAYGYAHHEDVITLVSGANILNHVLTPGAASDLTGTVTALLGGTPLEAIVTASRADTGEQVAQVTCGVDGTYTLNLFHYTYNITAVYPSYAAGFAVVDITGPTVRDFALESATGTVLVINDGPAKTTVLPEKYDGKGRKVAEGCVANSKGADSLVADLAVLGFGTVEETIAMTDPLTWSGYDFIVVACGNNTTTMADETFRTELVAYAAGGGKLLVEGGEVGYDWRSDPAMAGMLHVTGWASDSSGDIDVADPGHYVMSTPNVITGPITHGHTSYGDSDALTVAADAVMAGNWTSYTGSGSVICWSIDGDPSSGNTVFFTFNYDVTGASRISLLENVAEWLTNESTVVPTASISGTVTLAGATDYDGVLVELNTGDSVVTGIGGTWTFTDLYEGTYTVTASKVGYSTEFVDATVAHGEALTGVELELAVVHTACSTPAAAIPDNDPAGVEDVVNVDLNQAVITSMSVYIDITHTWRGDLLVELTSPTGTTVTLHGNTGSSADDILGWYPTELVPVDDLSVFDGELLSGDWTLFVADGASGDTGVINEWCLSAGYYIDPLVSVDAIPMAYALRDNYPNPFNPSTTIEFSLPAPGRVNLRIFDLSGRLVRTLVDENMGAAVHSAVWNGRDNGGRQVASGVYYYRLVTEGLTDTRKMVLVK